MPRNSGPVIPDEPLHSRADVSVEDGDEPLDSRLLDLDTEEEPAFLRGQKRVSVRRGPLPRKAANRLKIALVIVAATAALSLASMMIYGYGARSWRFRLESSDLIEIQGISHVTRTQVLDVMGADIGRNVFFVPLEERRKQLEEIPWVESASVMRLLPNRLKIGIRERTPMAFVQVGSKIALIDRNGVVMDLPAAAARKYSFPVIVGIGITDPLSTRAARMKIYSDVLRDLDSGGANYSHDLSEVDIGDPEDVKITVADPHGEVLVHLGSSNYLDRFKVYIAHISEWRQQFQAVHSVDLRYDRQVIVNPDDSNTPAPPKAAVGKPVPKARVVAKKGRGKH